MDLHNYSIFAIVACCIISVMMGCRSSELQVNSKTISIRQLESLRLKEGFFSVTPDSIIKLYKLNDPATFHSVNAFSLRSAVQLLDSLNAGLPDSMRVDTLAIDHTFENIGEAAHQWNTIFLSSSYFYLYNDSSVIRSVLFHEFGHLYYQTLDKRDLQLLSQIWVDLHEPNSFFLFRDGEYLYNSRFGGHPEDSPSELFASAFNLFCNNDKSVLTRAWLLPPVQLPRIEQLRNLVQNTAEQIRRKHH